MTPPEDTTRAKPRATCPDCGKSFSPRGLASHRRHRHPESVARERGEVVAAPVLVGAPDSASAPAAVGLEVVAEFREELRVALSGLGERLQRIEDLVLGGALATSGTLPGSMGASAFRATTPGGDADGDDASDERDPTDEADIPGLLCELEDVLAHIAAERGEDDAGRLRLGELRRRQFVLLFRLGEHAPGARLDSTGQPLGLF